MDPNERLHYPEEELLEEIKSVSFFLREKKKKVACYFLKLSRIRSTYTYIVILYIDT